MPDTQHSTLNTQHPLPDTPSPKPQLLIVEDDEEIRTQMKWALAQDYAVHLAGDRPSALRILKQERPAVVTLDLGLPPKPREAEEGFLALSDILQQDPTTKVIVITGQTERAHAQKAVGQGAYDFLCKPIQVEELKGILRRAFHVAQLEREHRELQRSSDGESFEDMVGTSPQMQEVFAAIRKVAVSEASVLIVGESGTGKELVARAIHRLGARRGGPFIAINCGAIPENLLESELFGHEKGAFTGAHIQRKGRIELAQGGTLFLDEIGELSLSLQVKLLRFLQEHCIERVGGRSKITVDARIITATNADLKQAMSDGRFRDDLYYRLGVVVITVPPLRAREGDLLLLAKTLLQRFAAEHKKKVTEFSLQALRTLSTYGWPGNVRELENRIKRAVIMAEGPMITPEDLELVSPEEPRYENRTGLRDVRKTLEKELTQEALVRHKGNLSRVAAELGISRPTLYDLMRKLGIERG
jgi:two-component system NtrC family response regulator